MNTATQKSSFRKLLTVGLFKARQIHHQIPSKEPPRDVPRPQSSSSRISFDSETLTTVNRRVSGLRSCMLLHPSRWKQDGNEPAY
ncbi:hypothetical protein F2Q70_00026855 [Brassica cretica]|uniref:Uncharacterized protein n=1 Tax=Brassica cretica TaxID=69181 RepID=A0A8S9LBN3_BRACR|nr:hypothetical protein F2Q70_00026855 [Brassica cretica]KAF3576297.1 hypothetical protein DY000_02032750 [Brassica cretica]